tara:strand:+ start:210 stop:605 length:396 start_codon:yes stop_codon:yes gene_type:complete
LGTTYRSFEKSILKTAEKCEQFTMSTKVIKFKTKDTSKVMSKDEAWQHYAAEMSKKLEALYSVIKTQHEVITSKSEELAVAQAQLAVAEARALRAERYLHPLHARQSSSSDSSSESESESEDNEAPPPYEQ